VAETVAQQVRLGQLLLREKQTQAVAVAHQVTSILVAIMMGKMAVQVSLS
jgi:hypothetical protein